MKRRQTWVDHKFETGIDIGWIPNILCGVEDTSIRLEYHCKDLNDKQLSKKENTIWSIKEHIGHLTDLEDLWSNRFLDFKNKSKELCPADMSNQKTKHSNHNEKSLEILLRNFKTERENTLRIFNALDENTQSHQAMHLRIKQLMRPVDLLFFIAEHDNHHIASIVELKKVL